MRSAFPSDRSTSIYAVVLLGALLGPIILYAIGPSPRREVYKINEESGAMAAMGREVYERHQPLDFLFFGSSIINAAIVPDIVENGLQTATGRKPSVLRCGPTWQGMDLQYVILRDLLARRKVKYLFLNIPRGVEWSNKPHIVLHRMLRFGDIPGFTEGLGPLHTAQVYAMEMLGFPRQMLSLLRPNLVGAHEAHLLDSPQPDRLYGYYGAPPVEDDRQPPLVPGDKMLHAGTSNGGWFRFEDDRLGDYQMKMVTRIGALARQYHIRVVMLNVPIDADHGSPIVRERVDWSQYLGMKVDVLGIPSAVLFQNVTDQEFYRFYVDQHLNLNGRRYYTKAILPGLKILLDRIDASN
jgi:hypothetical protein